jgi:hypothetical protein
MKPVALPIREYPQRCKVIWEDASPPALRPHSARKRGGLSTHWAIGCRRVTKPRRVQQRNDVEAKSEFRPD